jgi:hypothetical protein
LEKRAFTVNQLEEIVIPESVKIIGSNVFTLNLVSCITIPRDVLLAENSFDKGFDGYYNKKKEETYMGRRHWNLLP